MIVPLCQQSIDELVRWMVQLSIPSEDATAYSTALVKDGFDSISRLTHIEKDEWPDYVTKKGHIRDILANLSGGQ